MNRKTILLLFLCLSLSLRTFCIQTAPGTQTPSAQPVGTAVVVTKTPAIPATPPTPKVPYVISAAARKPDSLNHQRKEIYPGDLILVQITNPKDFVNQRPADRNRIVLYANEVELKGITSDLFNNIAKDDFKTTDTVMTIPFILKRDSSTKAAWDCLYKFADSWHDNDIKVNLSVGWQGMLPVKTIKNAMPHTAVTIVYFSDFALMWMLVIYVTLIVGLGFLVLNTDILKDGRKGAYSLAQTQLAFWTILVISGFIYSLFLTGIPSTINSSILTLLGISVGTNGIANYIDYFKKIQPKVPPVVKRKSNSFWRDILGDGTSINMQRFQIVAWNIVLGVYYTIYTFHNKTMPVIPDVLLTLAGISSLTYVAAKPAEKS